MTKTTPGYYTVTNGTVYVATLIQVARRITFVLWNNGASREQVTRLGRSRYKWKSKDGWIFTANGPATVS